MIARTYAVTEIDNYFAELICVSNDGNRSVGNYNQVGEMTTRFDSDCVEIHVDSRCFITLSRFRTNMFVTLMRATLVAASVCK